MKYCEICICELPIRYKRKEKIEIVSAAASYFGQTTANILGTKRQHVYVKPRYFAMYCMVQKGYKLMEIGRFFSKDHSSVIHARNSVENMFFCNKEDIAQYNEFLALLN